MCNTYRKIWVISGIISCLVSSVFAYSGGSGEPNNPYQIATKADLLALGGTPTDYNKCFILTTDINMGGQIFTTAIIAADIVAGNWWSFDGTAFTGTFDGNGHKVAHFTINGGSNNYLGLFGYISGSSSVKNLGIEDFAVSGTSYIGGLVGFNDGGSISKSYSTGSVTGGTESFFIGGLVGNNLGSFSIISDCYSMSTVTGGVDSRHTGGLVGGNGDAYEHAYPYPGGIITNCYNAGVVNGNYEVGGLVGMSYEGNITNCYNIEAVDGFFAVGGLIGIADCNNIITNCYNIGDVNGNCCEIGGLIGSARCENIENGNMIRNCYNIGEVNGDVPVGGLAGTVEDGSIIENCYNTGLVRSNWIVGGLVGYMLETGRIKNCYVACLIRGGGADAGGLVGYYDGPKNIIASFWDMEICDCTVYNDVDEGRTTAQMKDITTFTSAGWDFLGETANGNEDIWRMCVNGMYYPKFSLQFLPADFVCPEGVYFEDLNFFVQQWLWADCNLNDNCQGADMNIDGTVNAMDFAVFASNWLQGDD